MEHVMKDDWFMKKVLGYVKCKASLTGAVLITKWHDQTVKKWVFALPDRLWLEGGLIAFFFFFSPLTVNVVHKLFIKKRQNSQRSVSMLYFTIGYSCWSLSVFWMSYWFASPYSLSWMNKSIIWALFWVIISFIILNWTFGI